MQTSKAPMGPVIFCGWKPDLDLVLRDLMAQGVKNLIVISEVGERIRRELSSDALLSVVQVVVGEPFNEEVLKSANIGTASKIILVADWSDKSLSATESDAKTVLTAMAVEKLAPHVFVAAEILDLEFLAYLKMARVDEILYSREYTRFLTANAATSAGISHVIHDLMSTTGAANLEILAIPESCVGKNFDHLAETLESTLQDNCICIGVLENALDIQSLKKKALVHAQKSPEMKTILSNLNRVKEIETNCPVLVPDSNYLVPEYALAIVICNRPGAVT